MFGNFFKTALRVLWKRKSFSFLNVMGLAIGIAASLLLFLVIRNELTYDRFHKNGDRIYRLISIHKNSSGEVTERFASTPAPLPEAMRADFPQIEKIGTVSSVGQAQIYVPGEGYAEEKRFKETSGLFWTDPEIFEIFDYTWVAGSYAGLKEPNTVVLDESLAKRFYGSAEYALGKTIQLWSFRIPLRITGVFRDLPANTDLSIKFGASYATLRMRLQPEVYTGPDAWRYDDGGNQVFAMVRKGQSIAALAAQLPAFIKRYYKPNELYTHHLDFQPLFDMHHSDFNSFASSNKISKKELWSLGLIGLFLLLVACINFINLSTAQSVNRSKEIGVRKVLGSDRSQLVRQFLQETFLVTLVSVVLGCLLAVAVLPLLNNLMHKGLTLDLLSNPGILLYLAITCIIVTLLAGFYPALVLSGFKPAHVFRSKIANKGTKGLYLRRGLVVFQFVIAQMLIIGTLIVIQQMHYFRSQPLGFTKEGVMLINLPSDSSLMVKYPQLKTRVERIPGVASTAFCLEAPSNFWAWNSRIYYNNETAPRDFEAARQFGDTSYCKTFGLSLVAGRVPFYYPDSTQEAVVNVMMTKKLGLKSPEDIIGQQISFDGKEKLAVVGVVKDYNNRSLHLGISPIVITMEYRLYEWLAVRMDKSNMKKTMDDVQKLFTGIYPTYIYDRFFMDERIQRYYEGEAVMLQLFKMFAFLSILISCLGLYGLVSFMTVQKTKEVGIRKVLGASVQSIVYLFSKEFTILVGIAFLVAIPVAWYLMDKWLSGFHYRIDIGWGVFVITILISIVIAWITVGYKAIRAALVNPVKSLKTE